MFPEENALIAGNSVFYQIKYNFAIFAISTKNY